jgi:hypothetical protein
MVMLGSRASPPEVAVSQVPDIEDGMRVQVVGLLVDLYVYDSGTESLILADVSHKFTVKVIISPATRPQPSRYADVGDELRVLGEVSKSGEAPLVFARSDGVSVLRESEDVLTVDLLRTNWLLFEGDSIRLRGVLDYDALGGSLRLYDLAMNSSLALVPGKIDEMHLLGSRVVVTGILRLDPRLLSLNLLLSSIVPDN